jgi:Tfp pilus assembly protein PilF
MRPGAVLPRHILGMAYFYKGDSNEAIRQLNAALEIQPGFAQGHAFLGEIYFSKKDYKKAKTHFEKAISYDPNDFDSRKKLDIIRENNTGLR